MELGDAEVPIKIEEQGCVCVFGCLFGAGGDLFPETAAIQLSSALMNTCESSRVGTCLFISQTGPRVAAHEMETRGRKNPGKQPTDHSVPVRRLAVEALFSSLHALHAKNALN